MFLFLFRGNSQGEFFFEIVKVLKEREVYGVVLVFLVGLEVFCGVFLGNEQFVKRDSFILFQWGNYDKQLVIQLCYVVSYIVVCIIIYFLILKFLYYVNFRIIWSLVE